MFVVVVADLVLYCSLFMYVLCCFDWLVPCLCALLLLFVVCVLCDVLLYCVCDCCVVCIVAVVCVCVVLLCCCCFCMLCVVCIQQYNTCELLHSFCITIRVRLVCLHSCCVPFVCVLLFAVVYVVW